MLPPPAPPLPPPHLLQLPVSNNEAEKHTLSSCLNVPATGPPNSVSLSLLVYNGWPFANHWEYFISSPTSLEVGVVMQAAGNVREGFWLEIKRGWNIGLPGQKPDKVILLGWVAEALVEPLETVFRVGKDPVIEQEARCELEKTLLKVPAPEKTLRNAADDQMDRRARITQRNCQTWVVETSELLVMEGILEPQVVDFLVANKQY
ncbi:hypothetical protein QBC40DRAFT_194632 [Triangularia verruculosa]|uniref:Uncharacterized protein n=1 Tax=Triangularia verruculosa TaxID=2587418 RepID=A0AAN6XM36_9PEZI|nr:hypothetical protein QBC40DRAFT_194632 [Triangularia verruculosa]